MEKIAGLTPTNYALKLKEGSEVKFLNNKLPKVDELQFHSNVSDGTKPKHFPSFTSISPVVFFMALVAFVFTFEFVLVPSNDCPQ
jgi:hypothetical protein